MKRPKRAAIPQDVADQHIYWLDNDDTAPGDAWVCGDGGWHSRPVAEPCDECCQCSVETKKMLDEMNSEVSNVPQG